MTIMHPVIMTLLTRSNPRKPTNVVSSVAAALSWFFAVLANKNRKIMKIFGQLDHPKNCYSDRLALAEDPPVFGVI